MSMIDRSMARFHAEAKMIAARNAHNTAVGGKTETTHTKHGYKRAEALECELAIDAAHLCCPRRGSRRSSGSGVWGIVGGSSSCPDSSPSDCGHSRGAADAEDAHARAGAAAGAAKPRRRAADPRDLGSIEHRFCCFCLRIARKAQ
ncbi:unnamed protein product [Urochloa humidicola]